MKKEFKTAKKAVSQEVVEKRNYLSKTIRKSPVPDNELIRNLSLYMLPQDLQKILFINELYKKILGIHGVIMELGVRWGNNLSIFQNLRAIYEPFNHNRKILGFDTFEGFISTTSKDGSNEIIKNGELSVTENYEKYLDEILLIKEGEMPVKEVKKFEIIKGNAIDTLKKYLEDNPQTIISLAYFDMDLYEPTKECLLDIIPYLTKGSIIVFDELNHPIFPGETVALKEVFGLKKYSICRNKFSNFQSYIEFE